MEPIARVTAAIALLAGLSHTVSRTSKAPPFEMQAVEKKSPSPLQSLCPSGTLPDGRVCIPVPSQENAKGGVALDPQQNRHRNLAGQWRIYDQIPRRPDRPADYRRYRYPIPPRRNQSLVSSGYDLHLHDADQRRGTGLKAVGHGGIDLAQKRGTEVRLVNLEHQVGDADVIHVGTLFGNSVVTRHTIREAGQLREYIVIYGHLEGSAPGLQPGLSMREGSLIGFVGDSGSPGDVHLHLEIRQVRRGVDIANVPSFKMARSAQSVVCDPRNVLPLLHENNTLVDRPNSTP